MVHRSAFCLTPFIENALMSTGLTHLLSAFPTWGFHYWTYSWIQGSVCVYFWTYLENVLISVVCLIKINHDPNHESSGQVQTRLGWACTIVQKPKKERKERLYLQLGYIKGMVHWHIRLECWSIKDTVLFPHFLLHRTATFFYQENGMAKHGKVDPFLLSVCDDQETTSTMRPDWFYLSNHNGNCHYLYIHGVSGKRGGQWSFCLVSYVTENITAC